MPFNFKAHPLTVEDNGAEHFCRTNRRYAICGYVTDRHRIAWVEGDGSDPRKIADLFAAAPDLLAACEAAITTIEDLFEIAAMGPGETHRHTLATIKAVAAKARGVQA